MKMSPSCMVTAIRSSCLTRWGASKFHFSMPRRFDERIRERLDGNVRRHSVEFPTLVNAKGLEHRVSGGLDLVGE